MSRSLRTYVPAPAKVNLGLEVVGRRPDGFHDIVSILQTVSLFDAFEWKPNGRAFEYVAPREVGEDDLVRRSLELADVCATWTGVLSLHKRIPLAAGLGGGSADAALALRIARPSDSLEELIHVAATIGSDVPFFLRGGTALVSGIGDKIEQLPPADCWLVLVTPPLTIPEKTRTLYQGLEDADFSDGQQVREFSTCLARGDIGRRLPPNAFLRQLVRYPLIQYAYDQLHIAGARAVSVSGAGPTLYTAVTDYRAAAGIARRLPGDVGAVAVVRTVAGRDDPRIHRLASHMRAENRN